MDEIRLEFNKVYQGTILEINITNDIEIDYVTLQIHGCSMGCIILESIPALLVFSDRRSKFRCTIPKEALPTITLDEKFYIKYEVILNIFKGLNKRTVSYPFKIYSSYIYDTKEYRRIFINNDMIDITDSNLELNTSFLKIVKRIRSLENSYKLSSEEESYVNGIDNYNETNVKKIKEIFLSMIEEKNKDIENIRDFVNDTIIEYKDKGDLFFYSDYKIKTIENKTKHVKINKEGNLCNIQYNYYVKEHIKLTVEYFQNVRNTEVSLIYEVNDEYHGEHLLYRLELDGYSYKRISIDRNDNLNSYTIKSNLFRVDCYLKIKIDGFEIKLPIILLDKNSNIILD